MSFRRLCQRVIAHWRVILLVLILLVLIFALAAAIVLHGEFVWFELVSLALLLIFIASQIFWIERAVDLGEFLLRHKVCRRQVAIGVVLAYLFVIAYSFPTTIAQGHTFRIGFYRLPIIVTEGVFWWWFVGSMLAFFLVPSAIRGAMDAQLQKKRIDLVFQAGTQMKRILYTGFLEQPLRIFPYLHPSLVGLAVAPFMKQTSAWL